LPCCREGRVPVDRHLCEWAGSQRADYKLPRSWSRSRTYPKPAARSSSSNWRAGLPNSSASVTAERGHARLSLCHMRVSRGPERVFPRLLLGAIGPMPDLHLRLSRDAVLLRQRRGYHAVASADLASAFEAVHVLLLYPLLPPIPYQADRAIFCDHPSGSSAGVSTTNGSSPGCATARSTAAPLEQASPPLVLTVTRREELLPETTVSTALTADSRLHHFAAGSALPGRFTDVNPPRVPSAASSKSPIRCLKARPCRQARWHPPLGTTIGGALSLIPRSPPATATFALSLCRFR